MLLSIIKSPTKVGFADSAPHNEIPWLHKFYNSPAPGPVLRLRFEGNFGPRCTTSPPTLHTSANLSMPCLNSCSTWRQYLICLRSHSSHSQASRVICSHVLLHISASCTLVSYSSSELKTRPLTYVYTENWKFDSFMLIFHPCFQTAWGEIDFTYELRERRPGNSHESRMAVTTAVMQNTCSSKTWRAKERTKIQTPESRRVWSRTCKVELYSNLLRISPDLRSMLGSYGHGKVYPTFRAFLPLSLSFLKNSNLEGEINRGDYIFCCTSRFLFTTQIKSRKAVGSSR